MNKKILSGLAIPLLIVVSTEALPAGGKLELLISGPVESIDVSSGTVTVLNRRVLATNASDVEIGSLVNVFGRLGNDGAVSGAVLENLANYNLGSDQLYLKGKVTGLSVNVGRVFVDGAIVDYTALLSDSTFRLPRLGDTVEVTGTQPAFRGVILGSSIRPSMGAAGVVSTGIKPSGVVSTGSPLGVVSTGIKPSGVVSTGSPLGVVSTGIKPSGVVSTGSPLGVVSTGIKPSGVVSTGSPLGVVSTGIKPSGVVSTGSPLGVVSTGIKPSGVVSTGSALGLVAGGSQIR
jgi:hypothetical protein